jgi:hypothetical protein
MNGSRDNIKTYLLNKYKTSICIEEIVESSESYEVKFYKDLFTDWQILTKIVINKNELITFNRNEFLKTIFYE